MRPENRSLLIAALLVGLGACQRKADTAAVASSCGGTCPAGTALDEVRTDRSSNVVYADFNEGGCAWSCVAIAECPDGTVPVITESCFTCARDMPDGSLAGGDCDPEDWFAGRDDTPDGDAPTVDVGGSATLDEPVTFTGVSFVEAWDLGFDPRGLAWDGETLWASSWADSAIHRLEPTTGEILETIDSGDANPADLAANSTTVWAVDGGLQTYSIGTGEELDVSPGASVGHGLAWDGQYLLGVNGTQMTAFDPAGLSVEAEYTLEIGAEGPVAWSADRLVWASVVALSDTHRWTLHVVDTREPTPYPQVAVLSVDVDATPVEGLAIAGERVFVAGHRDGALAGKLIVLELE